MARPFLHLVRMGTHAEQDYVVRGRAFFDALVLNSNLVEGTKSALAVLVTGVQKPFYIDPVTYAYALDPRLLLSRGSKGSTSAKRTFVSLAREYGLDEALVGIKPLEPDMLEDPERLARLVARVLNYQSGVLRDALGEDITFLMGDLPEKIGGLEPQTIFAPYFVDDFSGGWRSTNMRSALEAQRIQAERAGAIVAIDSRGLGPQNFVEIAASYRDIDVGPVFLWLTDFDEHQAPIQMLRSYASLVELLAGQGREVYSSYGGFFSLLLAFRGSIGSSHGIGYGDKRNVEPVVGGGLPPARYYLPPLRDSIALGDLPLIARGLDAVEFRETVCSCTICTALLEQGGTEELLKQFTDTEDRVSATGRVVAVPTARVYRMSRFHFMEARAREYDLIRQAANLDEVLGQVLDGAGWTRERLGTTATAHLYRWIQALTGAN